MGLASEPVADIGSLFGGEITLVPFGAIEERRRNIFFGATNYCTNIQIICINMQGRLMGKIQTKDPVHPANREFEVNPTQKQTGDLLAILRKSLIMNGAGEGNRTLVTGIVV
jgi:hypothetical protein